MNTVVQQKGTQPMFDKEFLTKIAEDVVSREEELSHLEETGSKLVHFDFEILKTDQPVLFTGRTGDYYKFSFEYQVTLLDEKGLQNIEDEVRKYRRVLRLTADGNVSGVGERVELFD
jgi:hypothetical protein